MHKDGKNYCPNHNATEMSPVDGLHAITKLTKQGDQLNFHPSSGVPVKIFFCPKCGYIETYAAKLTEFWDKE